ncbi:hypothetical protein Hhel01_02797 [Haloferula helveola]
MTGAATRIGWGADPTARGVEIGAFEKIFQRLSYDEIGRRMAELGLDGIEATIRPGGHIEPERAADELPAAVEALRKHGRRIVVMASGINRADQPGAADLLKLAKRLGITRYRMNYYRYDLKKSPRAQVEEFKAQARDLAALNREIGIQAVYQNHAGANMVGAVLWDLDAVLGEIPKEEIGVGLDLRHTLVESGEAWKTGMALVRPRIAMIYAKDFKWEKNRPVNVALGTGRVTKEVFKEATKGIDVPAMALHVEYFGHKPLAPEALGPVMEAHGNDLKTLRSWM